MENENIFLLTEEELQGMTVQLPPPSQSILTINENFQFYFTKPMPSRWHRFWYRALLGWRWESVGKERKRKSARIPQWLRTFFFFAGGYLAGYLLIHLLLML